MVLLLLLCLTPLYLRAGDSITIDMKVLDGQTRKELQGVRVDDARQYHYPRRILRLRRIRGNNDYAVRSYKICKVCL